MRTMRFLGSRTPSPVTVTTRRVMGSPWKTARQMAATVPALNTPQPTEMGSLPGGTCRPVTACTSCFSAPWG